MSIAKVIKINCPYCGHELDRATNLADKSAKPRLGDLSVCISCSGLLEFDNNLIPIKIKQSTIDSLDDNTRETLMKYKIGVLSLKYG